MPVFSCRCVSLAVMSGTVPDITASCAVHKPQWDVICKQTKYITNSMDYSPSSEASRLSDRQESPHMLWNLKIGYCVHNPNI